MYLAAVIRTSWRITCAARMEISAIRHAFSAMGGAVTRSKRQLSTSSPRDCGRSLLPVSICQYDVHRRGDQGILQATSELTESSAAQFLELDEMGYRSQALGQMHQLAPETHSRLRRVFHGLNMRAINEPVNFD